MSKTTQRRYEAFEYKEKEKAVLTTKQYLVYSYLMSISKWNWKENEQHYYVYKNSFKVKDACQLLDISQPTWRNTIKKLKEFGYITITDTGYKIYFSKTYVPIELNLIKTLLSFGIKIGCGNIVSIYSLIYKYWEACKKDREECTITIGQIKKIFTTKRNESDTVLYKTVLSIFESLGLIELSVRTKSYNGVKYNEYLIKKARLNTDYSIELDSNSPSNVQTILEKIKVDTVDEIEVVE